MLGISDHVRPNVLLHHMVSGGLGNGPFKDFALLSVALRLHHRPHTFQVRGLYNPHTTQEGGCCHIKTWEQTQSTAWQIVPLASFSSPILTMFFVSLKNERKMVPKQSSLFAWWKFHRIQNTNYKRKQKIKQNKTKEPQTPSTLWSHFKLNILYTLEKKAASAFLMDFIHRKMITSRKALKCQLVMHFSLALLFLSRKIWQSASSISY